MSRRTLKFLAVLALALASFPAFQAEAKWRPRPFKPAAPVGVQPVRAPERLELILLGPSELLIQTPRMTVLKNLEETAGLSQKAAEDLDKKSPSAIKKQSDSVFNPTREEFDLQWEAAVETLSQEAMEHLLKSKKETIRSLKRSAREMRKHLLAVPARSPEKAMRLNPDMDKPLEKIEKAIRSADRETLRKPKRDFLRKLYARLRLIRSGYQGQLKKAAGAAASTLRIVERASPVRLRDLPILIRAVKDKVSLGYRTPSPAKSYVELAWIPEIKDTLLAVFNHREFMNLAVDRASSHIDGGKGILGHPEFLSQVRGSRAAGHDLRGKDLKAFREKFQKKEKRMDAPAREADKARLSVERDFWREVLLPELKLIPSMTLIAVSADDRSVRENLHHELLHARYFRDPRLRRAVRRFWRKEVPKKDKKTFKTALGSDVYDVSNEELMINEFHSYILELNGEKRAGLRGLVRKYKPGLLLHLARSGLQPNLAP